jgi:hypothetical protein
VRSHKLLGVASLWLLLSCAGLAAMLHYEKTSGAPGDAPREWPAGSAIQPAGHTLILFAHPHCPCTRASIAALGQILAHAQGQVAAHVVFLQPASGPRDWVETDLWRSAQAIPGVDVRADLDGDEARRFHASTSGQTVLYAHGHLMFAGGITSGRGHFGDSAGGDITLALLSGASKAHARTPVYGCPLESKEP